MHYASSQNQTQCKRQNHGRDNHGSSRNTKGNNPLRGMNYAQGRHAVGVNTQPTFAEKEARLRPAPENEDKRRLHCPAQASNALRQVINMLEGTQIYHASAGSAGQAAASELTLIIGQLMADADTLSTTPPDAKTATSIVSYANSIVSQYKAPNPLGIASALYHYWQFRGYRAATTKFFVDLNYKSEGKRFFHYLNPKWKSPRDTQREEAERKRQEQEIEKAEKAQKELKAKISEVEEALEQAAKGLIKEKRKDDAKQVREQKVALVARLTQTADEPIRFGAETIGTISAAAGMVDDAQAASQLQLPGSKSSRPKAPTKPSAPGFSKAVKVLSIVADTVEFIEALANNDGERAMRCLALAAATAGLAALGAFGAVILIGWTAVNIIIAVVEAGQNVKPSKKAQNCGLAEEIWKMIEVLHGNKASDIFTEMCEWLDIGGGPSFLKRKRLADLGKINLYKYVGMENGDALFKIHNYRRSDLNHRKTWARTPSERIAPDNILTDG